MALQKTMYAAKNNSPQALLTSEISSAEQTIPVSDSSVFPAAPNLATLGTGDNAELIKYAGISGNTLTGCVRGFNSTTPQIWPADTPIYRAFTAYDGDAYKANIEQLESEKLGKSEDGAENTETFTAAESRENIASGEKHSIIFGKIAKFFADLKNVAFTGRYSDLSNIPGSFTPAAHKSTHSINGADALSPADIGAQPKITVNGILKGDGTGAISSADAGVDYATLAQVNSKADKSVAKSVNIAVADWTASGNVFTATKAVAGLTANDKIIVTAAPANFNIWAESKVYCSAQSGQNLTFTAQTKPTSAITMNLLKMG